ncbi:hypothetical protein FACS18948_3740 [Clostridia bacterium]|nr:hypothetical protein FACS18948_3740 [Clostridia bacterium]
MNKPHFWNFARDANGARTLMLNGPISDVSWVGDEITPKIFRDELFSGAGPVTVYVNSPGGDVFAATEIYNALMDYAGSVTVKIDALAASAASIVAMAGERVLVSPLSQIMIHNPSTLAIGDSDEMLRAKAMLDEIKEGIVSAYQLKTGMSRSKISNLMDAESWFNAKKAIELGFADEIWTRDNAPVEDTELEPALMFSRAAVTNSLYDHMRLMPHSSTKPSGIPAETLEKRLFLLPHNN